MSDVLKQWLKAKLTSLVSVQSASIGKEPDLVAHLWSGVRIRIYLIHQPVKTRAIKRAVQDASNIGVGTMFIVAANLLPPSGTRFIPDEWLQAIHALSGDQIYAFQHTKQGPELIQTHFEPMGGVAKWEMQYGPHFTFNRLRFYTLSTRPRFIKGTWLVADFDSPAFWKDNDYRRHQQKERMKRRRATGNTHWHHWEGFQTWRDSHRGDSNPNTPMKTYLDACYENLGVKPDADRDSVKSAYRKLVREFHPDVSELPKDEAESRFKILTEAYEYIKSANNWQ